MCHTSGKWLRPKDLIQPSILKTGTTLHIREIYCFGKGRTNVTIQCLGSEHNVSEKKVAICKKVGWER